MSFIVTGTETIPCPICQGELKHYDRRNRKAIDENGVQRTYCLRRLRCQRCKRLHIELPDLIIPCKRYMASVIAAVITGQKVHIPYEERTIQKFRRWYRQIKVHFQGVWQWCLMNGFASPRKELDLFVYVRATVNSGFWPNHPYGR